MFLLSSVKNVSLIILVSSYKKFFFVVDESKDLDLQCLLQAFLFLGHLCQTILRNTLATLVFCYVWFHENPIICTKYFLIFGDLH